MTIKRIFCDMDGTLLNSEGQVSKSNATLIREAAIPVTLVSARAPTYGNEGCRRCTSIRRSPSCF